MTPSWSPENIGFTLWLWLLHSHGLSMALIEIDGLPFLKMVDLSMAMLNNQMVKVMNEDWMGVEWDARENYTRILGTFGPKSYALVTKHMKTRGIIVDDEHYAMVNGGSGEGSYCGIHIPKKTWASHYAGIRWCHQGRSWMINVTYKPRKDPLYIILSYVYFMLSSITGVYSSCNCQWCFYMNYI